VMGCSIATNLIAVLFCTWLTSSVCTDEALGVFSCFIFPGYNCRRYVRVSGVCLNIRFHVLSGGIDFVDSIFFARCVFIIIVVLFVVAHSFVLSYGYILVVGRVVVEW